MGYLESCQPLTTDCNTQISQAKDIYLEIETLYTAIQKELSATSVLKVTQTVGTLNALLEKARKADSRIAEQLKERPDLTPKTTRLLKEREDIIIRISRANKGIVANANNVKSLLRHEIDSMSTGHKAIQGYKPVNTERKQLIRDSF